jgi:excisionase family DNA binding protein
MQLLNVKEAASELRISAVTLRRFTKCGTIPFRRIGRQVFFTPDDLNTYLTARAVPITNPRSPGYTEGAAHE